MISGVWERYICSAFSCGPGSYFLPSTSPCFLLLIFWADCCSTSSCASVIQSTLFAFLPSPLDSLISIAVRYFLSASKSHPLWLPYYPPQSALSHPLFGLWVGSSLPFHLSLFLPHLYRASSVSCRQPLCSCAHTEGSLNPGLAPPPLLLHIHPGRGNKSSVSFVTHNNSSSSLFWGKGEKNPYFSPSWLEEETRAGLSQVPYWSLTHYLGHDNEDLPPIHLQMTFLLPVREK